MSEISNTTNNMDEKRSPTFIVGIMIILIFFICLAMTYNYYKSYYYSCQLNRLINEQPQNTQNKRTVNEDYRSVPIIITPKNTPTIQLPQQNNNQNNNKPMQNNVKLIVYHMAGCGHCRDIMENDAGKKSKFEQLKDMFKDDKQVVILDYKLGRDKEAEKFNAFPVIMLVNKNGSVEYQGPRNVNDLAKAIYSKKLEK